MSTKAWAIQIELPVESDKVMFHQASYKSNTTVIFYDASGTKIGQKTYPGLSYGLNFTREVFEAPPGLKIASMEVKSGTGTSNIGVVQWADRYLTGVSISAVEADGFGGRVVYGRVSGVVNLNPNEEVQVSTDGGQTWTKAVFSEGSWVAIQKDMPSGSWVAEVRVVDKSTGLEFGLADTKSFDGLAAKAPLIVRIENAEGIFTSKEAHAGSLVEVSLEGTGAKLGDTIHVCWGKTTYDYILTKSDIAMGHASIQVPSEQTYWQGAAKDFSVTVQIIGKDRTVGAVSDAYDVVTKYFLSAELSDSLKNAPKNNSYVGSGFKISVDGVLEKTAKSESSYAGLTASGNSSVAATVTFDKPVREVNLRLSGIDNELGVKVQVLDTKGRLIEEVKVLADESNFHSALFRYIPQDVRVDIGSFKVIAAESAVTLDGLIWREAQHNVDTGNESIIDAEWERFYGTGGDDVVMLGSFRSGGGIHGGDGVDTLRYHDSLYTWVDGQTLSSIEVIELTAVGDTNHGLTLNLSDVLRNGGTDVFYVGDKSRVQMMVKNVHGKGQFALSDYLLGGADVGYVPGDLGDVGDWMLKGRVTISGVAYDSYQHSGVNAEVLVTAASRVTLYNRREFIEAQPYESTKAATKVLELDPSSLLQSGQSEIFSPELDQQSLVATEQADISFVATQRNYVADMLDSNHALYAF